MTRTTVALIGFTALMVASACGGSSSDESTEDGASAESTDSAGSIVSTDDAASDDALDDPESGQGGDGDKNDTNDPT